MSTPAVTLEAVEILAAHVLYAGFTDDDPHECGCGVVEPDEVAEANNAEIVEHWWATHVAAALPVLTAEPWSSCTGASGCPEGWHQHGCFADAGKCDDPVDHHGTISDELTAEVERLRAALADNEAAYVKCNARADAARAETERLRAMNVDQQMRIAALATERDAFKKDADESDEAERLLAEWKAERTRLIDAHQKAVSMGQQMDRLYLAADAAVERVRAALGDPNDDWRWNDGGNFRQTVRAALDGADHE